MVPNDYVPTEYGYMVWSWQISHVEGKLLTLIEALGLGEKQESAIKNQVKENLYYLFTQTHLLSPSKAFEIINMKEGVSQPGFGLPTFSGVSKN